uniref:Competence domain-containing protein n=1 Tax=Parastrongyloides trichosuri TaxID=131310 RepID=A0A0N4ZFT0_PARTI
MTRLLKCLQVFLKLINVICIPLFIFASSILYTHVKPLILLSCIEKNESYFQTSLEFTIKDSEKIESSSCYVHKISLFTFAVFSAVRILSYHYEKILFKRIELCYMRQDFPCLHVSTLMAIPYILYQLCYPYAVEVGGQFMFLYVLAICLFFSMYSYIKGFYNLVKFISFSLKNKYYTHWVQVYLSLVALFIYGSLILLTFFNLIFQIPVSIFIYGYPLHYPYINTPLIFFLMHHYILRSHKSTSSVIYKVIAEDVYIFARRFKCINGYVCPKESSIYLLSTRPSAEINILLGSSNIISNGSFNDKVITVDNIDALDGWIIKKMKFFIPEMKVEVEGKYY